MTPPAPGAQLHEPAGQLGPYLKPREVAKILQVSVKSLYRWVRDPRSRLPVVRIGGTLRFSRPSLERWLQAEEQRGLRMRKRVLSVVKSGPSGAGNGRCADPCAEGSR